ncbi:MAG: (Fe-S)-binding protein [Nitriliruptorales bacterium]|nr:(Fe-S)-binding protein [Nitriliruptorales bacterium]
MRRTALFPTCVIDTVAGDVGMAVTRVLRARGYEVEVPPDATCCGQPAWNAGHADEAAAVARQTLTALDESADPVVCVPAGSCATMMRVYWPVLFRIVGDEEAASRAEALRPRIHEFSELLSDEEGAGRAPASQQREVAYHHSCHMLRELHIEKEPEQLLDAAGVGTADWEGSRQCCGFGGTFSVKQPEISTAMADDKLDDLAELGVTEVVGCDTSCLLHLRGRAEHRGLDLRFRHLAEVLDET